MKLSKVKKSFSRQRYKIASGSGLGLSAAAVIWFYHAFVSQHEYDKDYRSQQNADQLIWRELHQIELGNK